MGAVILMKTEIEVRKSEFQKEITQAFSQVLVAMQKWGGVNPEDDNFKDTPARVGKAYAEILDGLFDDGSALKDILSKTFPAKSSEMIVQGPVHVWSFCAHHLLPVEMDIWLGYMPKKQVLGLSKLARASELMSKKPGLPE